MTSGHLTVAPNVRVGGATCRDCGACNAIVRYTPIKPIGKGAYGVVCSAKDASTNSKVAIKKITDAFANTTDARRTLREIKLLRHLQHENIVRLADVMRPLQPTSYKDVYLVYELMDTDLHQIIRSPQALSDDHCQYFVYQLLRGLKYVHSANVLHRDLKPSNLLLNASCDLKICDFGLARTAAMSGVMTDYVVTRWYRAPELLLSCEDYTAAIDVWSVGCIMCEILGRKPVLPGKDYVHQLKLIIELLGQPSDGDMHFIKSSRARKFIKELPRTAPKKLASIYPDANPMALDLVSRMLKFDPVKRISVADALAHPYLAPLHDPAMEPTCRDNFSFDFEHEELGEAAIRQMIYQEACNFHPE